MGTCQQMKYCLRRRYPLSSLLGGFGMLLGCEIVCAVSTAARLPPARVLRLGWRRVVMQQVPLAAA
jgi:hypothetical protein